VSSDKVAPFPGFDPDHDVVVDPRAFRLRLRAELVDRGPATATQLASRIGESSGTTSYHLRQLATYGFVADDPSRGNGRERYWRALHRATWFDTPVGELEDRALGGEYLRAVARVYAERVVRFADSYEASPEHLGPAWSSAAGMSDLLLDLTVDETRHLHRRFLDLCAPYRHDPDRARPGSRQVVVQLQLLPTSEANA
jgi:DNA-binding transcriptional ArsR family regulator